MTINPYKNLNRSPSSVYAIILYYVLCS